MRASKCDVVGCTEAENDFAARIDRRASGRAEDNFDAAVIDRRVGHQTSRFDKFFAAIDNCTVGLAVDELGTAVDCGASIRAAQLNSFGPAVDRRTDGRAGDKFFASCPDRRALGYAAEGHKLLAGTVECRVDGRAAVFDVLRLPPLIVVLMAVPPASISSLPPDLIVVPSEVPSA